MKGKIRWFGLAASVLSGLQLLSAEVTLKLSPPEFFEAYSFKAIAGTPGKIGHLDGFGTNALFAGTTGLATDTNGNVYVADPLLGGQTIRRIAPDGTVTTLAGRAGQAAEVDGKGSEARFHQPEAVVVGSDGNLYVADSYGETIRKVTTNGVTVTLAGAPIVTQPYEPGDGVGSAARFGLVTSIASDSLNNLYVVDAYKHTVRKISPEGVVTTLGDLRGQRLLFTFGGDDSAIAIDQQDNLYVGDAEDGTILKANPSPRWLAIYLSAITTEPFYSSGLATAEASTDLKTWVPIATNVVYGGYESARIVDADAQSFPNRFYRAQKELKKPF